MLQKSCTLYSGTGCTVYPGSWCTLYSGILIISEFLKNTYYSPNNYINTKGRGDLVIHNGKDSNSTVGVLFELKKPGNKAEMPSCKNIDSKAFQELILYYLRERVLNKNIEIKYLVVTNILEWYIFNAYDFEKLSASDKNLDNQFEDFESERLSVKDFGFRTDFPENGRAAYHPADLLKLFIFM